MTDYDEFESQPQTRRAKLIENKKSSPLNTLILTGILSFVGISLLLPCLYYVFVGGLFYLTMRPSYKPQKTPRKLFPGTPYLFLSSSEKEPFSLLLEIREAQMKFRKKTQKYAKSVKELCDSGLIDKGLSEGIKFGYRYDIEITDSWSTPFTISMIPDSERSSSRQFRVNNHNKSYSWRKDDNSDWKDFKIKSS